MAILFKKVENPLTNFSDEYPVYGLSVSGQQSNTLVQPANSYSDSQAQWSFNAPNGVSSVLDRVAFVEWTLSISFAGADQGSPLLEIGTNDGLRCWPMLSCTDSLTMRINNQSISINPKEYVHRLLAYQDWRVPALTGGACYPDQYQAYADYVTQGANANPLGLPKDITFGSPRTYPYITVLTNTNTAATVSATVFEPIIIGCMLQNGLARGLSGVQTYSFSYSYSNLSRVWSHASTGKTFSAGYPLVTVSASPKLHLNFISQAPSQMNLSRSYVYDYNDLVQYKQTTGIAAAPQATLATPATVYSASSQVIQFATIPKRVYIYLKRQLADETYLTSDVCARIESAQVTWNNQNYLTQATSIDLFRMSQRNGLKDTWADWYRYRGSILCLQFGQDLMFSENDYVGKTMSSNFQVRVNYSNPGLPGSGNVTYDLIVVSVCPGVLINSDGNSILEIGFNVGDNVPSVRDLPVAYEFELNNAAERIGGLGDIGGGFFDSIWSGLKKVGSTLADVVPGALKMLPKAGKFLGDIGAATGLPIVSNAGQVLSKVSGALGGARGMGGQLMGGALMGGSGLMGSGSVLMGGAMRRRRGGCGDCVDNSGGSVGVLSNKQLEKRLR